MRILSLAAVWVTALAVVSAQSGSPAPRLRSGQAPATVSAAAAQPALPPADPGFVKQYCLTCHNERAKAGGLVLDPAGIDHVGADPEIWEKVVRKIKTGMMPPSGAPVARPR